MRQTRRPVSMRSQVYARLKDLSRKTGKSMSSIVERLISAEADRLGVEEVSKVESIRRLGICVTDEDVEIEAGKHFTL